MNVRLRQAIAGTIRHASSFRLHRLLAVAYGLCGARFGRAIPCDLQWRLEPVLRMTLRNAITNSFRFCRRRDDEAARLHRIFNADCASRLPAVYCTGSHSTIRAGCCLRAAWCRLLAAYANLGACVASRLADASYGEVASARSGALDLAGTSRLRLASTLVRLSVRSALFRRVSCGRFCWWRVGADAALCMAVSRFLVARARPSRGFFCVRAYTVRPSMRHRDTIVTLVLTGRAA